MDCLEFPNIPFHPSASIEHLCEDLCTLVGLGIWYDAFKIQNTKSLWFVNDIISALNNDNVLCSVIYCVIYLHFLQILLLMAVCEIVSLEMKQ